MRFVSIREAVGLCKQIYVPNNVSNTWTHTLRAWTNPCPHTRSFIYHLFIVSCIDFSTLFILWLSCSVCFTGECVSTQKRSKCVLSRRVRVSFRLIFICSPYHEYVSCAHTQMLSGKNREYRNNEAYVSVKTKIRKQRKINELVNYELTIQIN